MDGAGISGKFFSYGSVNLIQSLAYMKGNYSGIPIFRTSKGNGNCFETSGVRKIKGGIESCLFQHGLIIYCL